MKTHSDSLLLMLFPIEKDSTYLVLVLCTLTIVVLKTVQRVVTALVRFFPDVTGIYSMLSLSYRYKWYNRSCKAHIWTWCSYNQCYSQIFPQLVYRHKFACANPCGTNTLSGGSIMISYIIAFQNSQSSWLFPQSWLISPHRCAESLQSDISWFSSKVDNGLTEYDGNTFNVMIYAIGNED